MAFQWGVFRNSEAVLVGKVLAGRFPPLAYSVRHVGHALDESITRMYLLHSAGVDSAAVDIAGAPQDSVDFVRVMGWTRSFLLMNISVGS